MGALLSCFAMNLCQCACCMACNCCSGLLDNTLASCARIGHLVIFVITFAIAAILGIYYASDINGYGTSVQVQLDQGCNEAYTDICLYSQLIYRASFSLFLFFSVLAIFSACFDYVNKSLWLLKILFPVGLFVALWWGSNDFFSGFAEFTRFVSFFWLVVQGILLMDFAFDAHDLIMRNADEAERDEGSGNRWYGFYLLFSLGSLVLVGVGLAYLIMDYTGCSLGLLFVSITIIFGVITTIISLLNVVSKGLLTPCILFAYSTLLCWYALLSSPDESCNPYANDSSSQGKSAAIGILVAVSLVVMLYCVINGTAILNIFNPEGEGVLNSQFSAERDRAVDILGGGNGAVSRTTSSKNTRQPVEVDASNGSNSSGDSASSLQEPLSPNAIQDHEEGNQESGTTHERVFFHVLMALFSCYGAMVLTNWGRTNGAPEAVGSDTVPNESMWLKILSQWILIILFCRVLQVAYINNSE